MAVSIKIKPISKTQLLDIKNTLSPPAQKKLAADYAANKIEQAKSTDAAILGHVPPTTVTVDGRKDAPLNTVNPDGGSIIAEFELFGDVLQWITQTLRDRSPVVSGDYRDGHKLFADDTEIDAFGDVPKASQYIFTNEVPYSRKIEIGKTKAGRDFVIQVENRIYQRTADDAKAKFNNLAKIRFSYQPLSGGAVGKWASTASAQSLASRHKKRTKSQEWLTNQPAIIVELLGK